ncbi:hypothetical protein ARMSODRAFT_1085000 [Armillaria solidipes]|uniref:Uncharacterized protein n=1 Tax=Armillaria solidipes TaxID=1076256 RepID=A0A2H3BE44_9AGAR|nr:hypothetical protein ARMSODRAFT_1085000 [Armillaria solidipes]
MLPVGTDSLFLPTDTMKFGALGVEISTSLTVPKHVVQFICARIPDLIHAYDELKNQPWCLENHRCLVQARAAFFQSLCLCDEEWEILKGRHFLEKNSKEIFEPGDVVRATRFNPETSRPMLVVKTPSKDASSGRGGLVVSSSEDSDENIISGRSNDYRKYLGLLYQYNAGRELDDEGARKLIFHFGQLTKDEKVMAKEQTDPRVWCGLVFASTRPTAARKLVGYRIMKFDVRGWDIVPVKARIPCSECVKSNYPCEYTGMDRILRCKECVLRQKRCTLTGRTGAPDNSTRPRKNMIIDDHGDESDSDDEELSEEYKEYLHLLQNLDRGRTLDDEGIRKLVAQLYFVSPEEREIAKEQTDVRIWCRMVFAGIRATEARDIKGTKIGPRDIREWDAIPVKTVSPCTECTKGGWACEHTGSPKQKRCRECMFRQTRCTIAGSDSEPPSQGTRRGQKSHPRKKRRRSSNSSREEENHIDLEIQHLENRSPRSLKRLREANEDTAPQKRSRTVASRLQHFPRGINSTLDKVVPPLELGKEKDIAGPRTPIDYAPPGDEGLEEIRNELDGLKRKVDEFDTLRDRWAALRREAAEKVNIFQEEMAALFDRLP